MDILIGVYSVIGLAVAFILGAVFFELEAEDDFTTPLDGVTVLKFTAASFVGGAVWPVTIILWMGAVVLDRGRE